MSHAPNRIPVTLLTGYLGAGKTTLLNRILSADHGRKYAVLINEFGELGIDGDLLAEVGEGVVEMNNGCVCCSARDDMTRIVDHLTAGAGHLDGIIIETTGLAAPASVAQVFFADHRLRTASRLDAVVTVVDARHIRAQLADSPEAREQIAFADVMVLNKTDLATSPALDDIEHQLRTRNRAAPILRAQQADVPITTLLDRGAFDLDRILDMMPNFLADGGDHEHDGDITSVSLTSDLPIDAAAFSAWINALLRERGGDMLRIKAILTLKGVGQPYAFQAVHTVTDATFLAPWKSEASRQSRIVFIGRNLNRPQLRRGFVACAANTPS